MFRLLFDAERATARPAGLPLTPRPGRMAGIATATFPDPTPALRDVAQAWRSQAFARKETFGLVTARPRIKAVFFDMDATVTHEETINELARESGTLAAVARITEEAMEGRLDFGDALRQRVSTLKGLPMEAVARVRERLTVTPGLPELMRFLRQEGVRTYLVSGGFVMVASHFAARLGFDGMIANELGHTGHQLTGEVTGTVVDAMAKRRFVDARKAENGWGDDEVVTVGDGANDIPMMKASAFPVGFMPKEALLPHVCCANFRGDHRLLIDLLW